MSSKGAHIRGRLTSYNETELPQRSGKNVEKDIVDETHG